MESIKIILFSLGCAIGYGILHDQVTAHVCVECFTVSHPALVSTTDPTLLALVWGVVATWWVGLPLGVLAALAARVGPWPTLTVRDVRQAVLLLLLGMGASSILAGLAGFQVAKAGQEHLFEPFASDVPQARHALFIADWWAHENAYTIGTLGAVAVCGWLWDRRRQRQYSRLTAHGVPQERQFPLLKRGQVLVRRISTWAWDRTRPVGLSSRIVAIVALLALLWATSEIAQGWIAASGDSAFGYGTALLSWPVTVILVWLPGTGALLLAQQRRAALLFLALCVVVAVLGAFILVILVGSAGVTVIECLLLMDAGIIQAAWGLLLYPTRRPTVA